MTHLTHTGPDAGKPICGAAKQPGDKGLHAAYVNWAAPYVNTVPWCIACLATWAEIDGGSVLPLIARGPYGGTEYAGHTYVPPAAAATREPGGPTDVV